MRLQTLLGLAGLALSAHLPRRDYDANDYYVLQLDRTTDPAEVAQRLGMSHEGVLGALDDHHIFSASKVDEDVVDGALRERRRRRRDFGGLDPLDAVRFAQKQEAHAPRVKRSPLPEFGPPELEARLNLGLARRDEATVKEQQSLMEELDIHDPIFHEQWHLLNTVEVGHDVNVKELWRQGITGKNITVAIVDDGLDMFSGDLKDNYYAEGSYDFNDHDPEPKPELSDDRHGTRCAGEVAAGKNDVCGLGVAYDSKVSGLRILSKAISDADEALALMYDMQHNDIYSCSWGPPDDGRSMDAPSALIRRAMLKSIQQGRGGLGSIYVFASGNGASNGDNCNFDGYTNSIYSITVGAVARKGHHPYYSESCSANLVVTYSSGDGDAIHTTDVGSNSCYTNHGGTSAAAPLAAGIFALALSVRPDLTWRDMQALVMKSAVPINMDTDGDYQLTTLGRNYSHMYGYGKVDSFALVEMAKDWELLKPQAWFFSPWIHVNQDIAQGREGLHSKFTVTPEMLQEANLERVEHVTVTMNVKHTNRGDLSVDLISPDGIKSQLSVTRKNDRANEGYRDWTFMSVAHWGESGVGDWNIIIRDSKVNEDKGSFTDWHLKLWGESIDPDKATLLPMPQEDDDADHAVTSTVTAPASTVSLGPHPDESVSTTLSVPTDHPHRPTKIQATTGASTTATTATTATTQTSQPTVSNAPQQGGGENGGGASHWISWLPTFGVSRGAQAWIYGALALILVFCVGVAFYLWRARRKGTIARDSYEFELLQNEGEEKNGRRRQRGGELYDAFAGGSDDDLEDELLASEDEEILSAEKSRRSRDEHR